MFGNDIEVGPLVVLTALSGGKLSKLILKFNFLLNSRALARFDAEMFQRRVNCYIVSKKFKLSLNDFELEFADFIDPFERF